MKLSAESWQRLLPRYLKRDRLTILFWIVGLSLFAAAEVPIMEGITADGGQVGLFQTLSNPAMVAMLGPVPVSDLADYTFPVMYSHMMLLFSALFSMILSSLHVVSHSRREEDSGLLEMIRALPLGRLANSVALFLETVLINIGLGLAITALMLSFGAEGMDVYGTLIFAGAIAMAGVLGAGIALLVAQLAPTAAAANAGSIGVILLLYMLRAWTDIRSSGLSRLNPLSWAYLVMPYAQNAWRYLIYSLILGFMLFFLASILEERRDLGASFFRPRVGRREARRSLLSVWGLWSRLNRGTVLAWYTGLFVLGASYGSIYGDMQSFVDTSDLLKQLFGASGGSLEASFTATLMVVMAGLAGIVPISVVNRLGTEERSGRLAAVLGTRVSRSKLYWLVVLQSVLSSLVAILVSSLGLGLTAIALLTEQTLFLRDFVVAGMNLLPSVLLFVGLAAVGIGIRASWGRVAYIYLIYSFMLSYFSGMAEFPKLLTYSVPQHYLPLMPTEAFRLMPWLWMLGLAAGLFVVGSWLYRRRDLEI